MYVKPSRPLPKSIYNPVLDGDAVIQQLVSAMIIMIPFAIDPHGKWGPMMDSFLFGIHPRHYMSFSRKSAQDMYDRTHNHTHVHEISFQLPQLSGNIPSLDLSMDILTQLPPHVSMPLANWDSSSLKLMVYTSEMPLARWALAPPFHNLLPPHQASPHHLIKLQLLSLSR